MAANSAEWKSVPIAASVEQRYADTSVDGMLTNGYLQKDDVGNTWVRRRGGLIEQTALSLPDATYSAVGIMDLISGAGGVYTGGNSLIYKNGSLAYTYSTLGFQWFDQSTVTTVTEVYAANGNEGAYDSGSGLTKITDANYPAHTVKGSAYLNGFLYVMDLNGSIWGTPNQNDFSTWSSTNVINAWGTPGQAVALRSYLNEILAFKTYSVEVFYDAGNTVGSPLLPVQQVNIKWGLLNGDTIQKIDDQIFWIGQSQTGEIAAIGMAGFVPQVISNESINRILGNAQYGASGSCSFSMGGDKFYGVTVSQTVIPDRLGIEFLLAYNLSSQEWSVFNTTMSTSQPIPPATSSGLAIRGSTYSQYMIVGNGQVLRTNDALTTDQNHTPGNATQIVRSIAMDVRTDNFDMGTSLRKMVSGMRVKADQKAASTLRVRWSDDDYQTWSAWRSIDLSKSPAILPGLQGTFSKRAYEFKYDGVDPIRLSKMELLIALGDV